MVCMFFFFSSRRRHTRFDCDWSSDVCSSDLRWWRKARRQRPASERRHSSWCRPCRSSSWERSEERRVGKSVDLGGRRIIKKKKIGKGSGQYEKVRKLDKDGAASIYECRQLII